MSQGETDWVECATLLRQVYDGTERDLQIVERNAPTAPFPRQGWAGQAACKPAVSVKSERTLNGLELDSLTSRELVAMADAIVPQVPALAGRGGS